jgi:hypothetical protein
VAQPRSIFCPRHTFLANIKKLEEDTKDREKHAQRIAATGGAPQTRAELLERGYQFTGSSDCYSCHVHIEWWRTPMGRSAPYNPMPELNSHAKSHFATCTHAAQHRKAS